MDWLALDCIAYDMIMLSVPIAVINLCAMGWVWLLDYVGDDNRYKGVPNEITEQYLSALSDMGILTLGYTHIVNVEVKIREKKTRGEK